MSPHLSEYWYAGLHDESGVWPTNVELKTYCDGLPNDLDDFEDRLDSICKLLPLCQRNCDAVFRYGPNVSIQLTRLSNDTLHISVLDNNLHNGTQRESCAFQLEKSVLSVWHVSPEPLHPSRLQHATFDRQTSQNSEALFCQQAFRMCVVPAILQERTLFQNLDATRNDQKMNVRNAAASAAGVEASRNLGRIGWRDNLQKRLRNFIKNGPKKN